MTHTSPDRLGVGRRTVVAAAGASGLVAALAACGSGDKGATPQTSQAPEQTSGTSAASGAPETSTAPSAAAPGGAGLARTSDIPEGGGKVFADRKVVVTQPVKGEFKAFSAVCTHQGCVVGEVRDGTINCPCHGSRFSVTDGSVRHGPAQRPLPAERISVEGGTIRLG
ncbi:Rieske 2Fe-2S domain-containing protein [Streptomyces sp. NPDC002537]